MINALEYNAATDISSDLTHNIDSLAITPSPESSLSASYCSNEITPDVVSPPPSERTPASNPSLNQNIIVQNRI
ncbi:hypothetical protein M422DRAFT_255109 [Sphaerobolus stellatus SS14]|uniref:Uncharacterized protein n=1 Tax=Sphaerobolus stellatus (strain SS14) TaxID=990650 RepID=A0A0C9VTC8_SPHS4|nr:hypothetical protein M422DRAFT_255109 [Sphaerobolus stellatus SS14]